MRRTLPLPFLFLLLPVSLSAQTNSPASAPSVMQSASGQKLHITGIHNAGKITDALYRGAQPDQQGLSELKKLGITTIIDLRGEDRDKVEWERGRAESLGMQAKVGIAERADRLVSILVITGLADLVNMLGVGKNALWAIPVTLGVLAVASTVTVIQRVQVVYVQAKVIDAARDEAEA